MISRAEKHLPASIPDGKGKIAYQLLRTALTPFSVGCQDQLTVTDFPEWVLIEAQGGDKFIPVVNAGVGCEHEVASPVH
jgi:hypothetical protein